MDSIIMFMESKSLWVYICVFLAEVLYTMIAIVRGICINRGERVAGTAISLIEIVMWVVITGTVLSSVTSDPLKIVAYALGFSLGNYIGTVVESKLALGTILLSIFLPEDESLDAILLDLKEGGYGASILDATGIYHARRKMIVVVAKRKNEKNVVDLINRHTNQAVIATSAVASMRGGYIKAGSSGRILHPRGLR